MQTVDDKNETSARAADVRARLTRIRAAEAEAAELNAYQSRLDAELQAATDAHQTEAQKIQGQLQGADVETRIALRQRLAGLNADLERRASDIAGRQAIVDEELQDLAAIVATRPEVEAAVIGLAPEERRVELHSAVTNRDRSRVEARCAAEALDHHLRRLPAAPVAKSPATWSKTTDPNEQAGGPTDKHLESLRWRAEQTANTAAKALAEVARIRAELLADE